MSDIQKIVSIGDVRVFPDVEPDKEQAKKVLEEAAELYAAWSDWNQVSIEEDTSHICEEACDVIMAVSNLLSSLGVHNLNYYMRLVEDKNEMKGRY